MLSFNVVDLLRATPGTAREYPVFLDGLVIADDLSVAAPVEGVVRLSNTGRGILARAQLRTALPETCSRCLVAISAPVEVEFTEEALPSVDLETGTPVVHPDEDPSAFLLLDDHHELDLSGAVRDAVSLAEPIVVLCRPDCRGLCLECGADRNADPTHGHGDPELDPRMAALLDIRERLDRPV